MSERRPLSPGRLVLFSLFAVLLFLGVTEGLLRVVGVQGAPDRTTTWFSDHILNPPLWHEEALSDPSLRFMRAGQAHHFAPFTPERSDDAFRVAVFGGSAAHGYGVLQPAAFPHRLEQLLQEVYPTVRVEVVNLGTIAWSSQQLLWAARQVVQQGEWDLAVVYSGHNELLELSSWKSYLEPAEHRRYTKTLLLNQRLEGLRLFAVARRLLGRKKPTKADADESNPDPALSEGDAGPHNGVDPVPARVLDSMERVPAEKRARMGPLERRYAARTYTHNIGKLVDLFRDKGAQTLLINPAPNDYHDPAWFPYEGPDGARFAALLEEAETLEGDERFEEAEAKIREALKLHHDPIALFSLARNLGMHGPRKATVEYLIEARRWAEYPNRVVPEVSEAILAFEGRRGVLGVLDAEALFRAEDEDGVVDYDLVYDHCHPSVEGSYLIAGDAVRFLRGERIARLGDPDEVDLDSWVASRRRVPLDREAEDPRLWEWSGLQYSNDQPTYIADNQGDWLAIRERHEAAVDSEEATAMDWLWAGNSRFLGYEVGGALEAWGRAARMDPGLCLTYANRATAFKRLGQLARAAKDADAAVACNPTDAEYRALQTLLKGWLGD